MIKNRQTSLSLLLYLFISIIISPNNSFAAFRQVSSIEATDLKRIAVSELGEPIIYVASENSLYESQDRAKTFKKLAVLKDENIKHIFLDPNLKDTLYIASDRNIYRLNPNLEKIFSVSDDEVIYTLAGFGRDIYVGTSEGVYLSDKDSIKWYKSKSLIENAVYYIEPTAKGAYLAAERGVYFFQNQE